MARKRIRRIWDAALAKTVKEGKCRGCGKTISQLRAAGRKLETAHTIGRTFDVEMSPGVKYVHPNSTIPLCGPAVDSGTCHRRFDGHELDLWPKLTDAERKWAIDRIGEGQARRKISGRAC